jgi:hypothetical protein
MKPIKTLKEFKEFIATKPTLCLTSYKINGQECDHKFKGIHRKISVCNTNGFTLGGGGGAGSYLVWPRLKELSIVENEDGLHFTIRGEVITLTYKVIIE